MKYLKAYVHRVSKENMLFFLFKYIYFNQLFKTFVEYRRYYLLRHGF